ncbi:MAG: hypothetical protein A2Y54_02990 [Chloroflexi bacterium RBG_16_51_16]|nr:MAG: hypothetical protein A2Y54_02990 [Chloroflexi bacterium RBG_16_51_16]
MLNRLRDLIRNRLQPKVAPDSLVEPARLITSKVLLLVYDPVIDRSSGATLSSLQGWYRVSELVSGFIKDILNTSKGLLRYQIEQRLDVDEFPAKIDGFRYTPEYYLDVLRGAAPPHRPQEVDYLEILSSYKILPRIARSEIDEVWIFSYPNAGFYESTMGGPGAFWCNSPPLKNTAAARRRFIIMGFSYERHFGEMLESFGHRAESILMKTYENLDDSVNLWKRFTRYEKIAPGQAACGTIHFAPNSQRDYDWNNPTPVRSESYDWLLNFPEFKGDVRMIGSTEWGSGDIRAHHLWWLNHFPRVAGRRNGIHNNWWQVVGDPNMVKT